MRSMIMRVSTVTYSVGADADQMSRYLDTAHPRLRSAQVTLLPPNSTYTSRHAKGGEDTARVGLEDWKAAKAEIDGLL